MKESNEIVVPGELLAEKAGRKVGKGAYFENNNVYARVLGIPKIDKDEILVIPISGVYIPFVGDKVIGVITSVEISGWSVDINSPYDAFLPLSEGVEEYVDTMRADLSRYFEVNDLILCSISRVTRKKIIQVSMRDFNSRKLRGGIILRVTPSKIPRIIGKGGSMINLIKNKTDCEIITGQNGIVWIRGEKKDKALEIILKIEKESHMIGLTEKIEKLIGE